MVGRLVEQQEVRAAHQRLREIEPHPPAAGEARDRIAVARVGEAKSREQRRSARARARSRRSPRSDDAGRRARAPSVACASLRGGERALDLAQLARRRRARSRSPLCRRRASPARRARSSTSAGISTFAGVLVQLAGQQREQARLAAAVRADQPDLVPGVHGEDRAFEQALRAAGEREVRKPDHGRKSRASLAARLRRPVLLADLPAPD